LKSSELIFAFSSARCAYAKRLSRRSGSNGATRFAIDQHRKDSLYQNISSTAWLLLIVEPSDAEP